MAANSGIERFLHRFYLSNYFISRASMEMEQVVFGSRANKLTIGELVFVTGLARSGTTALTNWIFSSGAYASLQYANMPFLLIPNLWKNSKKITPHERAHKDGIMIHENSPEEFDEYFWKTFLEDAYISKQLKLHAIEEKILKKYLSYISLICLAKGKQNYLSKNNNNILRLPDISKIKGSKILLLFREPLSHSQSLLKLHRYFSELQTKDPFALEYFNFLGHHEFGLNHKPFLLNKAINSKMIENDPNLIDYWLLNWINYYQYLLENPCENCHFISFSDLIGNQEKVISYLNHKVLMSAQIPRQKKYLPQAYPVLNCNKDLLQKATLIYEKLKLLRKYP